MECSVLIARKKGKDTTEMLLDFRERERKKESDKQTNKRTNKAIQRLKKQIKRMLICYVVSIILYGS